MNILNKIKEAQRNIECWYKMDSESEEESEMGLKMEKDYLNSLKEKIGQYRVDRIKRLMESIECF
jgi:hypothetical protein